MGNIFPVIGWIAWVFVFYLAVVWALGCRKYARAGRPFTFVTAMQTMFLWIISLLFLQLPGVYKLHILWIVPLLFFSPFCYFTQATGGVLLCTSIFMRIILLGTGISFKKIVLSPPPDTFSTSFSTVLKVNLAMMLSLFKRLKSGRFLRRSPANLTRVNTLSMVEKLLKITKNKSVEKYKDKIKLIRDLSKRRVQNDPVTSMSGDVASILGDIESFSEIELMGLPEATIVTIVETYWQGKTRGLSDKEILETIENYRVSFDGNVGTLPSEMTLSNYIKYRVRSEHYSAPISNVSIGISDNFIDEAIKEATRAFTQ